MCQGPQELEARTCLSSGAEDGWEPISALALSCSTEHAPSTVWVPESGNTSKGEDSITRYWKRTRALQEHNGVLSSGTACVKAQRLDFKVFYVPITFTYCTGQALVSACDTKATSD